MNCKQAREEFFGLVSGSKGSPAMDEHLRDCAGCAQQVSELRRTMALLDEWRAPEPSPYFDARLRARLREERETPRSWAAWLRQALSPVTAPGRKVALAAAMTMLMAMGVALFQPGHTPAPTNTASSDTASAKPGSAVSDLQALDKNGDLYANFDLLDDVNP